MAWLVKILAKSTLTWDKRLLLRNNQRVNSMQKAFNFKASQVYMLIKYLHDKVRM